MIFDFLTITGADDNVDLLFIDDMTTRFSFVEWGILLSEKRKGQPRYPSDLWLAKLTDSLYTKFNSSFSAHICGSMCERLILEGAQIYQTGELVEHSMPEMFSRLQLNSFPELCDRIDRMNALASNLYEDGIEIILPIPNEKVLEHCRRDFLKNISFLHDKSRGTGAAPPEWPDNDLSGYVGYAGGIGPDNIRATLDTLCGRPGDRHFWLDLESGARTDDHLDVKKVETVLTIAESYLT